MANVPTARCLNFVLSSRKVKPLCHKNNVAKPTNSSVGVNAYYWTFKALMGLAVSHRDWWILDANTRGLKAAFIKKFYTFFDFRNKCKNFPCYLYRVQCDRMAHVQRVQGMVSIYFYIKCLWGIGNWLILQGVVSIWVGQVSGICHKNSLLFVTGFIYKRGWQNRLICEIIWLYIGNLWDYLEGKWIQTTSIIQWIWFVATVTAIAPCRSSVGSHASMW